MSNVTEWINADEIKPPKVKSVLVVFKNIYGHTHITIAQYVPPKSVLAEDFLNEEADYDEYDEEKDCYWCKEGWFEYQYSADINYLMDDEILFWAYLPENPVLGVNHENQK